MPKSPSKDLSAADRIRQTAAELQAHRDRPCLLYVSRQIIHADVLALWEVFSGFSATHLDVIISSPGGDVEAAYLVARELRRRVKHVTAYTPFRAKSAASLICLAADELVLGSLGELGPLDQQYDEKMAADFPLSTSRLLLDTALAELQERAFGCYETAVQRILKQSGMRPFEACSKAAELTGALYGPLLTRLDPVRLSESARGLALGRAYAARLLQRSECALAESDRERILDRLVRGYPAHSFILDREEIKDIGLPVREPDATEAEILDCLALSLIEFGTENDLIEMVAEATASAGESSAGRRQKAKATANRKGGSQRKNITAGAAA